MDFEHDEVDGNIVGAARLDWGRLDRARGAVGWAVEAAADDAAWARPDALDGLVRLSSLEVSSLTGDYDFEEWASETIDQAGGAEAAEDALVEGSRRMAGFSDEAADALEELAREAERRAERLSALAQNASRLADAIG